MGLSKITDFNMVFTTAMNLPSFKTTFPAGRISAAPKHGIAR